MNPNKQLKTEVIEQATKGNSPSLITILDLMDNQPPRYYFNLRTALDFLYFRELPDDYIKRKQMYDFGEGKYK